ncbi:MAG: helix-turn-helix domain-containing protein [Enterococcus lemanii]|jgi:transcriptional regulator with XRE-family HTH domain
MVTAEQFKAPYYKLKMLMDKKGLTQSKMAEELMMDRATFNLKINRKNGRDFTFAEAIKIANLLDEKIDNFF